LASSCTNAKRKSAKRKKRSQDRDQGNPPAPEDNVHHRDFKVDDARRWLLQGHKVRVTVKFRGREMDYPEIALEDLKEIAQSLSDVGIIEQAPMMEGRTMLVVLGPPKRKRRRSPKKANNRLRVNPQPKLHKKSNKYQ